MSTIERVTIHDSAPQTKEGFRDAVVTITPTTYGGFEVRLKTNIFFWRQGVVVICNSLRGAIRQGVKYVGATDWILGHHKCGSLTHIQPDQILADYDWDRVTDKYNGLEQRLSQLAQHAGEYTEELEDVFFSLLRELKSAAFEDRKFSPQVGQRLYRQLYFYLNLIKEGLSSEDEVLMDKLIMNMDQAKWQPWLFKEMSAWAG